VQVHKGQPAESDGEKHQVNRDDQTAEAKKMFIEAGRGLSLQSRQAATASAKKTGARLKRAPEIVLEDC